MDEASPASPRANKGQALLLVTAKGLGKRLAVSELQVKSRNRCGQVAPAT